MAKPKKNGKYLNVCIDSSVYDRLDRFSDDAGQATGSSLRRLYA